MAKPNAKKKSPSRVANAARMREAKRERERVPPRTIDDLSARQRLFVAHYLGASKLNASDAARRAGYLHPNVVGPRIARLPVVQAAIEAKLDEAGLTADEVMAHLSEMATATLEDFLDEAGNLSLKVGRSNGKMHLVKKVRLGPAGQLLGIELYGRDDALDKVAKVRRMYDEGEAKRVEVVVRRVDGGLAAAAPESGEGEG
jgi:phage terminase small subunit